MPKISFSVSQLEFYVNGGSELKEVSYLPLKFGCKNGGCGVCAIHVQKGLENLSKVSKEEEKILKKCLLEEGYRLACQCAINGDITIKQ